MYGRWEDEAPENGGDGGCALPCAAIASSTGSAAAGACPGPDPATIIATVTTSVTSEARPTNSSRSSDFDTRRPCMKIAKSGSSSQSGGTAGSSGGVFGGVRDSPLGGGPSQGAGRPSGLGSHGFACS